MVGKYFTVKYLKYFWKSFLRNLNKFIFMKWRIHFNERSNSHTISQDLTSTNSGLANLFFTFDQVHCAIFIINQNLDIEYANPSFTDITGYSKEDLISGKVLERIYRVNNLEYGGEIVESLRRGASWEGELLAYSISGSLYWVNVIASPYKDEVGNIKGHIIIQQNINERKRIEVALRESEAKYKALVDNSQDGILIVKEDNVLFANNAICRLLGYDLKTLIELSSISLIHPDDYNKIMSIGNRRRNNDYSTINESLRMVAKDSSVKTCETTSTLIQFGNEWANFFTIHDITESKRMQLELKENEEKYRLLFTAESDAIFMIDALTGQILDANPAATIIYGFTHEELLTMKNTDVSAEPEKTIEATRNLESLVNHRVHKRKDGSIFDVELSAGFTTFNGKKVQIVTSRDITQRIKVQDVLVNSERKYRELAAMLPLAVYELDEKGNLTYMNYAGLKMFDVERETDKIVLDFFTSEDIDGMNSDLKLALSNVNSDEVIHSVPSVSIEYNARKSDGTVFPVLVYASSMVENGQLVGFRGIIVDIAERKAMEDALRESESKYKTLIENSQDGIFAIVEDRILFANNTFSKIIGYTQEELYDKSAASLVHIEDRPRGLAISELRKRGDYSTKNDIFRFVTKNGFIVEGDVFSSVLELNGQLVSFITVHDLTESRRMQEQLQISEDKYRTLIEKANDGIIITQLNIFKYVNISFCKMIQYNENELINQPFLNFVHPDDIEMMYRLQNRRIAGEEFQSIYRCRFICKDKKIITIEVNARTSELNGQPAGFIVARNITDRLLIEEELRIAKQNLEMLNSDLEKRFEDSSKSLVEARTQLINLQKENLQSQFDVLKQQVNPHFLFNSLNVLASLIKLEPDLAEKFSEQLSKVYRYVLENKDNELVDLNTELNFLDAYIFLLNIRFVDKLIVKINIPNSRRGDQIIPLAMQLLIENAIKHNVMSKSEPLVIDIFIDSTNYINVINNLQERPSQLVSTGVGLKNIQNRYRLLNNTEPTFRKTKTHFIARVPLVIF
jgi:PAS domain S-box-containing protein